MKFATITLVVAALAAGCDQLDNCPDRQAARRVETGKTYTEPLLLYESAPRSGPLEPFPAQTELVFVHALGAVPEVVQAEVSFFRDGIDSGDVASAAGNEAATTCVDDEVVVVKNETCEPHFYVRVTAIATGQEHADEPCAGR